MVCVMSLCVSVPAAPWAKLTPFCVPLRFEGSVEVKEDELASVKVERQDFLMAVEETIPAFGAATELVRQRGVALAFQTAAQLKWQQLNLMCLPIVVPPSSRSASATALCSGASPCSGCSRTAR